MYVVRRTWRFGIAASWEFAMTSAFYILALLACPVSMGLMMFMMMRGQNNGSPADRAEVDALRAEIEALKADRAAHPQHPQP
jgi:hypothetical protein